jgi:hypothetical protein
MPESVNILLIGDIVGGPGRRAVREYLPLIRNEHPISLVIANVENAAGGFGLTPSVTDELLDLGLDVLTSGNHIWDKKDILGEIDSRPYLLRPANYPPGVPGRGLCTIETEGLKISVLNLSGRVFMGHMDCPFQAAENMLAGLKEITPVIILDFHAEATSEKQAMGWFLDGRVTAVIGTHTHVQTRDARLLPRGTAYITDAGMTGPSESVIGVKKDVVISRFLTQMPHRFETARRHPQLEGVIIEVESESGRALGIQPLHYGGADS